MDKDIKNFTNENDKEKIDDIKNVEIKELDENVDIEEKNSDDNSSTQEKSNIVSFDKEKIDKVLDSFLREQELKKEKEEIRQKKAIRNKRVKRLSKLLIFIFALILLLLVVFLSPATKERYSNYLQQQSPKEDYLFDYNYSSGMVVSNVEDNLVIYDSNDIKILKKDGSEIVSIPFSLGNWDMKASKDRIYILDKIDQKIYFINSNGDFIGEQTLDNIPYKIYSGKNGNLVLHYKSESGVEGIKIFDKNGKMQEDVNYPKTTIMFIDINDSNEITVHGMNRVESKISNYIYRYSARGNLEYTKVFEDVIFVRQYENANTIAFVDVNQVHFFSKSSKESTKVVESSISSKLIAYDENSEKIYILDKRNKLRILNMQGEILEEKYFQSEYNKMIIFKGSLLLVGEDYIRTPNKEIKYQDKIINTFIIGDYFVIITKNQIKMTNKME